MSHGASITPAETQLEPVKLISLEGESQGRSILPNSPGKQRIVQMMKQLAEIYDTS